MQYSWWLENVPKREKEFVKWLGGIDNVSRKWFRKFVKDNQVESVLDVAAGACLDYDGLKAYDIRTRYKGLDITPFLVEKNLKRGIDCEVGNIEEISESDNTWDLVYARHIIEHLEYYDKAVEEMCRVAKRYVVIVHFLPMSKEGDKISITRDRGGQFYENMYDEDKFVHYCSCRGQVQRIDMNDLVMRQTITLIKLK